MGLSLALAAASYWLATLPGLKVMGALTVALLVGIAWRAAAGLPAVLVPGTKYSARTILRLGIVLMGARLDFGLIAKAGPQVLLLDVAIIAVGILGISWIARRSGVDAKLAMLLAVGTSICGASAVAAAAPVTKAGEDDTTLAVALCGVLGTVGVLFYVLAGPMLGLTTSQLAIMSGSTLHEVAQVMAAAFTWGTKTGDLGTLVKLTRVVLLAPALVALGVLTGGESKQKFTWKEPPIPWFVIGFLALGGIGSLGLIPAAIKGWLSNASIFLMVAAMAAMGLNTHLEMIRKAGMRVIYAGLAGWGLLAATSYGLIRVLNIH
jgi:uncharacterized integral membrane protein (TIGR00698 family)